MSILNKKLAIVVDNYFEQAEFEEPLKHFKNIGCQVTVVGTQKDLQALQHVKPGRMFTADVLLQDVDIHEFDGIILPGGVVNADKLRMEEKLREWVRMFVEQNKLVAAICHAPWVLISADCVQGRRITSYYTLQDDLRNAGAEWIDQEVVEDNNIITSRKPDDIPAFNSAIADWFE